MSRLRILVTEGVERSEQREALLDLCCDLGQGFHFAEPLDAGAFLRHVEKSGTAGPE